MKKLFLLVVFSLHLLAAGINIGDKQKDFTLKNLEGTKSYTLSSLKGNVVLLNVWASWCKGCKAEMPEFFHLQEDYKEGFKIIAVSVDKNPQDAINFLSGFEKNIGFKTPFPVLSDTKKSVAKAYRCRAMPSSYLIDKKGIIRDIYIGSLTSDDMHELKKHINTLRAQ